MSEPRRVLVAPDSFKGTYSAVEVTAALADGLAETGVLADPCPVADGGEGTASVLRRPLGGEWRTAEVTDALGRPVSARFMLAGNEAYLDLAEASGLGDLAVEERDPVTATTFGTGQLMLAAHDAGAKRIVVAAGGSATVDGGAGAIQAINEAGGLEGCELAVLCDVVTPFELAAEVFGPQKGASPEQVEWLTQYLDLMASQLPQDPRGMPMGGAAGGFSGGLWAAFGAELLPGAPFVLDRLDFNRRLAEADAVIAGEGRLDSQSFDGKILGEILGRAATSINSPVPLHAVVGTLGLEPEEASSRGIASVTVAGDAAAFRQAGAEIGARL